VQQGSYRIVVWRRKKKDRHVATLRHERWLGVSHSDVVAVSRLDRRQLSDLPRLLVQAWSTTPLGVAACKGRRPRQFIKRRQFMRGWSRRRRHDDALKIVMRGPDKEDKTAVWPLSRIVKTVHPLPTLACSQASQDQRACDQPAMLDRDPKKRHALHKPIQYHLQRL
jgi:hypothetical protein